MERSPRSPKLETLAVHAGDRKKLADYVPATTPIYAATSFFYDNIEDLEAVFDQRKEGHGYSRYGNPTTGAFEEQIRALEGADFALATSSGMSAMHLSLVAALTDRRKSIVAANVLYGQTLSMLMNVFEPMGAEIRFADPCDLERFEEVVAEARPACVLVETVSNPLLRVPQLDKVSEIARRHGALTVVDSTFTTPVLMRPFEHGADVVVHSGTKYLGGHGDALCGVVLAREEHAAALTFLIRTLGCNLSPFDSYLAMRGVKTLALRIERQCKNACEVAARLRTMDGVERVYFPGDPEHPDHEIAKRFFPEGFFGAVVTLDIEGGRDEAVAFMNALEMVVPATSVGDVHTMVLYPPMSSHRDLAPKHRQRLGIGDGMVRLSIGIEAVEDIVADIEQAVAASRPAAVATG